MSGADLEALGWKVYPDGASTAIESQTGGANERT